MRTVTITHNIYQYNELSEAAKQKVKDWYLNDPCRAEFFQEDIMYNLGALFNNENHSMNIQFDLSYCQGDGVNIYGSVTVREIISFLKNDTQTIIANPFSEEDIEKFVFYSDYIDKIELPWNSRYAYCLASYIEFANEWIYELENCDVENVDAELINKFEGIVKNIFSSLCKEYEKCGYEYLYEISDDEMQEDCEANEWEFYEDGNFYW